MGVLSSDAIIYCVQHNGSSFEFSLCWFHNSNALLVSVFASLSALPFLVSNVNILSLSLSLSPLMLLYTSVGSLGGGSLGEDRRPRVVHHGATTHTRRR